MLTGPPPKFHGTRDILRVRVDPEVDGVVRVALVLGRTAHNDHLGPQHLQRPDRLVKHVCGIAVVGSAIEVDHGLMAVVVVDAELEQDDALPSAAAECLETG